MTDLVDMAAGLQDEHLALSLSRVARDIPAGTAGECEDCGEQMPRLVGGRCAFCRDGRPHPFERAPAAQPRPVQPASGAPARVAPPPPVKETTMPNPVGTRTVGFAASGDVLRAIEARVGAGTSISAVVKSLVQAGLHSHEQQVVAAEQLLLDLSTVPLADLLDELRARVDRSAENDTLLARATAAEAKLAAMAAVLAPAGATS